MQGGTIRPNQTIGVIGAGVMGTGVAHSFSQAGHSVILVDIAQKALDKARQELERDLRLQLLFQKGHRDKMRVPDFHDIVARIRFSTDIDALSSADWVIENVPERFEVKAAVYERLDQVCRGEVIFGANTSAILITWLASLTRRPSQVVGTHFMNPVPVKRTVEVIRGRETSQATVAAVRRFLASVGMEAIVVGDSPGFVSNRILMAAINEAVLLLEEEIATAEDIDRVFRSCLGHKMGPLETADLIGLDVVLDTLNVLRHYFGNAKFRPPDRLTQMVREGKLGRKSGQGFYEYYRARPRES